MDPRIATGGWGYACLQTPADALWFDEGMRRGWRLPGPAPHWQRRWGVRHIRWAILTIRIEQWNRTWIEMGMQPTGYESWICYAVGRGWI